MSFISLTLCQYGAPENIDPLRNSLLIIAIAHAGYIILIAPVQYHYCTGRFLRCQVCKGNQFPLCLGPEESADASLFKVRG